MGAVDIGVGHDDDALVTQLVVLIALARAAAERLNQIGDLLVLAQFVGAGAGDVENLATQRQNRLRLAVAGLLGGTAGAIAFDQENLSTLGGRARTIGELAGQSQLAGRALAVEVLLLALAQPVLGAVDHFVE